MKTSVKRRAKNCIRGAVLLACFIAVWYVASCFTQPLFIPAPAAVWEAIVGLAETGQLQKGLAYSFLRITGASALSMLVAIPLSLLIYGVKPIKETIMPVVSFLRYVPVTAFSPLLILWFGIGEQMKISFLFIATFVYLLPSILLCFDDVWRGWNVLTSILHRQARASTATKLAGCWSIASMCMTSSPGLWLAILNWRSHRRRWRSLRCSTI